MFLKFGLNRGDLYLKRNGLLVLENNPRVYGLMRDLFKNRM